MSTRDAHSFSMARTFLSQLTQIRSSLYLQFHNLCHFERGFYLQVYNATGNQHSKTIRIISHLRSHSHASFTRLLTQMNRFPAACISPWLQHPTSNAPASAIGTLIDANSCGDHAQLAHATPSLPRRAQALLSPFPMPR